jgi:hypothetical protein
VTFLDSGSKLHLSQIWLGGSAFCDVLIAAVLVTLVRFTYFLRSHLIFISTQLFRANIAMKMMAMKSVLSKLIVLTIETGVITAVAATLELILFLVYRNTFVHFVLSVPPSVALNSASIS